MLRNLAAIGLAVALGIFSANIYQSIARNDAAPSTLWLTIAPPPPKPSLVSELHQQPGPAPAEAPRPRLVPDAADIPVPRPILTPAPKPVTSVQPPLADRGRSAAQLPASQPHRTAPIVVTSLPQPVLAPSGHDDVDLNLVAGVELQPGITSLDLGAIDEVISDAERRQADFNDQILILDEHEADRLGATGKPSAPPARDGAVTNRLAVPHGLDGIRTARITDDLTDTALTGPQPLPAIDTPHLGSQPKTHEHALTTAPVTGQDAETENAGRVYAGLEIGPDADAAEQDFSALPVRKPKVKKSSSRRSKSSRRRRAKRVKHRRVKKRKPNVAVVSSATPAKAANLYTQFYQSFGSAAFARAN